MLTRFGAKDARARLVSEPVSFESNPAVCDKRLNSYETCVCAH